MSVLEFFNTQHIFGIFLKLFGVIVGFLYLFFSLIILRQVGVMKKTVTFEDKDVPEAQRSLP
jgi:hypothetical protein